MTVQGILKCMCHRHSQLLWRATLKAAEESLPGREEASPHTWQSWTPPRQLQDYDETRRPWWRRSWEVTPVPTRHHRLCIWQRWGRCCSDGGLSPASSSPWLFTCLKSVWFFLSIYKAWLFQQTTSDPHRYFVINLYIKKKSPSNNRFWFASPENHLQQVPEMAPGTGDNPGTESWEKHVLCVMILWHDVACHALTKYQLCVPVLCLTLNVLGLFSARLRAE